MILRYLLVGYSIKAVCKCFKPLKAISYDRNISKSNTPIKKASCDIQLAFFIGVSYRLFDAVLFHYFGFSVLFVDCISELFFHVHYPWWQYIGGNLPYAAFLVHGKENSVSSFVRHIHTILHIGAVGAVKIKLTVPVSGFYNLRKMDTHCCLIAVKTIVFSGGNNRSKMLSNNVKTPDCGYYFFPAFTQYFPVFGIAIATIETAYWPLFPAFSHTCLAAKVRPWSARPPLLINFFNPLLRQIPFPPPVLRCPAVIFWVGLV